MTILIRSATIADFDAIEEIERHSFAAAWTQGKFAEQLSLPTARLLIATLASSVVGYINYSLLPPEAELLSIATHPDYRQRGIATALLAAMQAECIATATAMTFLEVRKSNRSAQALYVKHGFAVVRVRSGYYADGEDAVVMAKTSQREPAETRNF